MYVNSCSQGALSDSVRAAYEDYLTDWDEKGAPWAYWVERAEAARASFAGLVGAAVDEVAVTTSLSAGVSALASALDYGERPRVVVSDFEFPTVGQIWHAQELRGAEVVHVPQSDGEIPVEHFDELIDERTKLVAVTAVCYRNGARLPVEEIVELAHARGALVLLDAYQAIGSYPIDVRELGVDFLGAGALKYLLASAGLGFLWCREGLVESLLPTQTGWFADRNIFEMDIHDYSPVAHRPPLRVRDAADPGDLRRHRRHRADPGDRDRRDPRPRDGAQRAADLRRRRARRLGGDATRPRAARRARLHPLDRRARLSSARSPRTGSSPPTGTGTCASRRTPTTSRKTSTPSSPRSRAHRELLRQASPTFR